MFGEKLRYLRSVSGKSQKQVVEELKARFPTIRMSKTIYSALEKRSDLPRRDILATLIWYWETTPDYFGEQDNAGLVSMLLDDNERKLIQAIRDREWSDTLKWVATIHNTTQKKVGR